MTKKIYDKENYVKAENFPLLRFYECSITLSKTKKRIYDFTFFFKVDARYSRICRWRTVRYPRHPKPQTRIANSLGYSDSERVLA